jgi:catechol 2,3-dioxygenase-like lactoylglutathione lyase family enzyme
VSRILGAPVHQAYVYPDFDEALKRFAGGGIGPFYVMQTGGVGRYRGEAHALSVKVAFVYTGDVCFEIMSPNGERDQQSAYDEFLRRNPEGGLHHIAYYSDDFDKTLATLEAEGKPLHIVQEFTDPTSGAIIEIYCEPVGVDNPVLFQLIRPGLFDPWFEAMRTEAANWDGSDPYRDARPLMAAAMAAAREKNAA